MQNALVLTRKRLGDRAIDTAEFDPCEADFSNIRNTTWLELQRECYVEPERYFSGIRYRLSGRGWLACIEAAGQLDDFKIQLGPIMRELKASVKGRRGPAFEYLDSLASGAGVSVDFAYNVVESDAIGYVLGRHGVKWEHRGKMICIDEDFGLEPL